jgi:hypothetical protein
VLDGQSGAHARAHGQLGLDPPPPRAQEPRLVDEQGGDPDEERGVVRDPQA